MSDFDDRASRNAAKGVMDTNSSSNGPTLRWKWMATAAAVTLGVGGMLMIGVVVISDGETEESAVVDSSPTSTPSSTSVAEIVAPTSSAVPSTTVDTSVAGAAPSSSIQPSTSAPTVEPVRLSRPMFDPVVCTSVTAGESESMVIDDLILFARPSELAVPIQVIGDPTDGEARPFALVQRHFDRDDSQYKYEEMVMINDNETALMVWENGNGEATWPLPDGSQGYLRSRGLDREQIVYIVERLSPRPGDAEIPGFDFTPGPTGDEALELVAEQMNTTVSFGPSAQSQCEVEATGNVYGYRVTLFDGDPVARFAVVIDRPVPLEVSVIGGAVAIIAGFDSDEAPTIDDVIQADELTWLALRGEPTFEETQGSPIPISEAQDVIARLEPDLPNGESGFLTVQLRIEEGVPFLQVDSTDTSITGRVLGDPRGWPTPPSDLRQSGLPVRTPTERRAPPRHLHHHHPDCRRGRTHHPNDT